MSCSSRAIRRRSLLDRRQLPRLLLGLQRLRPRLPRPHREPDEHHQPQHRRVIDRVAERLDPRIAKIMGGDAGNGQRHRRRRPRARARPPNTRRTTITKKSVAESALP